jgi:hypothetical protein
LLTDYTVVIIGVMTLCRRFAEEGAFVTWMASASLMRGHWPATSRCKAANDTIFGALSPSWAGVPPREFASEFLIHCLDAEGRHHPATSGPN